MTDAETGGGSGESEGDEERRRKVGDGEIELEAKRDASSPNPSEREDRELVGNEPSVGDESGDFGETGSVESCGGGELRRRGKGGREGELEAKTEPSRVDASSKKAN